MVRRSGPRRRARIAAGLHMADEVLERVPVIILVGNRDGDIVYANAAVQAVLGYHPEEILGDRWWQLTRSGVAAWARARDYVARCARREIPLAPTPYEECIRTRSGVERYIVWHDAVGPGETVIGVGQDITERRRVEVELELAREAAEAATRTKSEFLASVIELEVGGTSF